MACNCGKNRTAVRYRLTLPDGTSTLHGTRRSAEIARERKGGKGTIEQTKT